MRDTPLLACGAFGFGAGALAAEPRIGKFVSYDVRRLHHHDLAQRQRRRASSWKTWRSSASRSRRLLGKRAANVGIPTHIVIVSTSDWEKYLQPRQNVAGWFQSRPLRQLHGDERRCGGLARPPTSSSTSTRTSTSPRSSPANIRPGSTKASPSSWAYAKFTKDMAVLQIPMYRVLRSARRRLDSVRAADPRRSQLARVPDRTSSTTPSMRRPGSRCTTAWSRTASSARRSSTT